MKDLNSSGLADIHFLMSHFVAHFDSDSRTFFSLTKNVAEIVLSSAKL